MSPLMDERKQETSGSGWRSVDQEHHGKERVPVWRIDLSFLHVNMEGEWLPAANHQGALCCVSAIFTHASR